jgi:sugar phosphate isomerase/epimerase
MHRRDFLRCVSAGLVIGSAVGGCAQELVRGAPSSGARYPRPGLQLFTVMTLLDRDFRGTLRAVADIGYREVETMGAFDRDPGEVRAMLAEFGLSTPSQHLMPGALYADFSLYNRGGIAWEEIIRRFVAAFDFNRVEQFVTEAIGRAQGLGQSYVVWQMNWLEGYGLAEARQHIAAFNLAGKLCRDAGLTFAFHNHNLEFAPLDGSTAYDLIVQNTDPDLVKLEMDFMWATTAGIDPVAYFERYPGRFKLTHLKDRSADGKIVVAGTGIEDFPRLLKASEAAGIEHAFVEYDQPTDPLAEIIAAYRYLSAVERR